MTNNNTQYVIRYIKLLFFAFILSGLSLIVWKQPVYLFFPEIYEQYLVPVNGHPLSFFVLVWFCIGGYKTALIMLWDENEAFIEKITYRFKAVLVVPIAAFLKFNTAWTRLPSEEYLQHKQARGNKD